MHCSARHAGRAHSQAQRCCNGSLHSREALFGNEGEPVSGCALRQATPTQRRNPHSSALKGVLGGITFCSSECHRTALLRLLATTQSAEAPLLRSRDAAPLQGCSGCAPRNAVEEAPLPHVSTVPLPPWTSDVSDAPKIVLRRFCSVFG
jgi:hypothetical protein